MDYFDYEMDKNGHIYSVDMLRLEIKFKSTEHIQAVVNHISNLEMMGAVEDCRHYDNFNPFKYRYLLQVTIEKEQSFALGWNIGRDVTRGFIEVNPNKVGKNDVFRSIFEKIWNYSDKIRLKRYDLAVDLKGVARWRCGLVKDGRAYSYILDKSKTEYLGQRNQHNFVKLYDKAVERGFEGDWTRAEITIEDGQVIHYPEIRIREQQDTMLLSDDIGATDKVLYRLCCDVENPFVYIRDLPKRRYLKLKDLLEQSYKVFEFDTGARAEILRRVCLKFCK